MRLPLGVRIAALPLLLLAAGCSSDHGVQLAPVSGTVEYQGQPLEGAEIVFYPEQGRPAYGRVRGGQIQEVSTFDPNDGVTVGKCRVIVRALQGSTDMYTPSKSLIPARYANADASGLTAEIAPGEKNVLSLKLSDRTSP